MIKRKIKIITSLAILLIMVVCSCNKFLNKDEEVILNKDVETKTGTAVLSMMYETEAGSGNYVESTDSTWPSGYAFNETLSKCEQGGTLTWNEAEQKVYLSTNKSDKCYVYFDKVPPKYWNDELGAEVYLFPDTPSTTYGSVAELQTGFADFANNPYYIKTTTEHQTCLHYNNKEFCIGANYWVKGDTDGSSTKAKLQKEMSLAFGISESDLNCASANGETYCEVSSFSCSTWSDGSHFCGVSGAGCMVLDDGTTYCY